MTNDKEAEEKFMKELWMRAYCAAMISECYSTPAHAATNAVTEYKRREIDGLFKANLN